MMRPLILSSPEKLAFLLVIFCAGGSVTTSSPGCSVAGVPGTFFGWRCPGGNPGSGLAAGGATATPCPGCGGAPAKAGGALCGKDELPGGVGRRAGGDAP